MRNLWLFSFLLVLATTAKAATASLTYDTVSRQILSSNLWFQYWSTPTTPTASTNVANKAYVDSQISTIGGVFPFQLSHNGLVTTVGAGVLQDHNGNLISVASQTVTNVASITSHLVVTLSDLTVRSVRRALHSGCVPIGTVTCNGSAVTSATQPKSFNLPPDPLYRLKAKLNAGQLVRVVTLGTSLMDYSSGATNIAFRNLLFNTTYVGDGYNVPGAAGITQLRYSQGATGPNLSTGLIGKIVANPSSAFTFDAAGLGIALGPVGASYDATPPQVYDSPLPNSADLVLIDGYNFSTYLLSLIEVQMKKFATRGADVIVINSGPNTSTTDYRYDQGPDMRRMCDAHGWAFADVNAFQRAALDAGDTSLFIDGVHQSEAGNQFYAARIRDIINDYVQTPQAEDPSRWNTVTTDEMTSNYDRFIGEDWDIVANPAITTGLTGQSVLSGSTSQTINPLVLFGGYTIFNTITVLETNEYAVYGHPMWRAMYLMVEIDPAETVNIDIYGNNGGTLIKNYTATFGSGSYSKGTVMLELFTQAEAAAYASDLVGSYAGYLIGAFPNAQVRLVNKGAKDLKIIAPVFTTMNYREVDLREWSRGPIGVWIEENDTLTGNQLLNLGNDTVGATVRLNYHGRGILVFFQQSTHGGSVRAVHDGVATTLDTYHATSLNNYAYLAAPDVEQGDHKWTVASRQHALSLTTTIAGTNGVAGQRSMTIKAAYVIE